MSTLKRSLFLVGATFQLNGVYRQLTFDLTNNGADMAQAESCGLECFSDFDNLTQYHYVQTELCPSEGYLKSGFLTITQGFTLFRDVYILNTLKTLTDDNKI